MPPGRAQGFGFRVDERPLGSSQFPEGGAGLQEMLNQKMAWWRHMTCARHMPTPRDSVLEVVSGVCQIEHSTLPHGQNILMNPCKSDDCCIFTAYIGVRMTMNIEDPCSTYA